MESADKNVMIDRVESLAQVDEYSCIGFSSMAFIISLRTLSVAEVHP